MPRHISFAATLEPVRKQEKTVTRRYDAWEDLEAGTLLKPVESQSTHEPVFGDGTLIRVTDVRTEPLNEIRGYPLHECPACNREGFNFEIRTKNRRRCEVCQGTNRVNVECTREGRPDLSGEDFVEFFLELNSDCEPESDVTRIAFEYVDPDEDDEAGDADEDDETEVNPIDGQSKRFPA